MGKINLLKWKKLIQDGARLLDLHVSPQQADLFAVHASELLRWNRKTNLTSITDPFEIAIKHFLDSIAAAPLIPAGTRFLDIGSGGGFPGIPLKIMLPSNSALLIDASRKKTAFLQHLIRLIKLPNISAGHLRSEHLQKYPEYKNFFDVIVCRALADLKTFIETACPLLSDKGFLLAYKANITESEINQIQKIECSISGNIIDWVVSTTNYRLPFIDHVRTLVVIRKLSFHE
ncbi:MAG: 16S rRNA (guanine(527)-N(7))-methyltransferase RsmG [Desulfobacterales bacterium]